MLVHQMILVSGKNLSNSREFLGEWFTTPPPPAKRWPVSLCVFRWGSYDGNCKKMVVLAHSELLKICTKYGNRKEEKIICLKFLDVCAVLAAQATNPLVGFLTLP